MKELTEFLDKYNVKYTINGNSVEIGGNLSLHNNQLTSLPESFGNLKVGGDLYLYNNQLTSLPESFGNLKVGGNLSLSSNQLTSLPESFGSLKVGGNLYLHNNQLTSLPESFGNLKVGGNLYLSSNQLTSLPDSFGSLKVGGDLSLSYNQLTRLPDSFGSLKVGGNLSLYNNKLTSLPDSFGSLKVGGNLSLYGNQLTVTPKIPMLMADVIESDWCFIDRIMREVVSKKTINGLTVIKTPFDFVVGDGEFCAHGKTIKEAKEDLQFKKFHKDPEELKCFDLDKEITLSEAVMIYRAVTGSCMAGCERFLNSHKLPAKLTLRKGMEAIGGAYGSDSFKAFFEVSA